MAGAEWKLKQTMQIINFCDDFLFSDQDLPIYIIQKRGEIIIQPLLRYV